MIFQGLSKTSTQGTPKMFFGRLELDWVLNQVEVSQSDGRKNLGKGGRFGCTSLGNSQALINHELKIRHQT
jgi:hypothetical protein